MKGSFKGSDLQMRSPSTQEFRRIKGIFDTLKDRARKELPMSQLEEDFFYTHVEFSKDPNDAKWKNYLYCDNPRFKYTYLTYCHDITGGGVYWDLAGTKIYRVPPEQSRIEIEYLINKAIEWEPTVQKTNHRSELLQQSSKEARSDLKTLDASPEFANVPFSRGSFLYKYKKWSILLRARYIYLKALEIFEELTPDDLMLTLAGNTIEINEYSIIHVTSRHFAGLAQQSGTKKSYHVNTFLPWLLGYQLRMIFIQIDQSKLSKRLSPDKIAIQYNGTDYLIWTAEKERSIAKTGQVKFRRLETFYPVEEVSEINKLKSQNSIHKINNELSVYLPM